MKSIQSKKLSLARETLRQLTSDELNEVAGGTVGGTILTTTVGIKSRPGVSQCDTTSMINCAGVPALPPIPGGGFGFPKP